MPFKIFFITAIIVTLFTRKYFGDFWGFLRYHLYLNNDNKKIPKIKRTKNTKKTYANKKSKKKQNLLHSRHSSIFHFFL